MDNPLTRKIKSVIALRVRLILALILVVFLITTGCTKRELPSGDTTDEFIADYINRMSVAFEEELRGKPNAVAPHIIYLREYTTPEDTRDLVIRAGAPISVNAFVIALGAGREIYPTEASAPDAIPDQFNKAIAELRDHLVELTSSGSSGEASADTARRYLSASDDSRRLLIAIEVNASPRQLSNISKSVWFVAPISFDSRGLVLNGPQYPNSVTK